MKKTILILTAMALLMSSCGTSRSTQSGTVWAGAGIGGQVGSAIGGLIGESSGGWRGSYRGSAIGSILGTAAGAVIAHAATKPKQQQEQQGHSSQVQDLSAAHNQLRIRNIRFIDENSNQTVNAGENCKIIFEIMNEGDQVVKDIVPVVVETTGAKRIVISPSVMVERIAPHNGVKYTANLSAEKRLRSGEIIIHLAVADAYGNEYDTQEFELRTER